MAVVGIKPQDAVDNFAVFALAGEAADLATARITPAELDQLARDEARQSVRGAAPTQSSRRVRRNTLPEGVRGMASTKTTWCRRL
jgi:hypothetical protein